MTPAFVHLSNPSPSPPHSQKHDPPKATTDEVRDEIAPVNRRHDLAELMGALAELWPRALAKTPGRGDDFVILEYVMLEVGAGC